MNSLILKDLVLLLDDWKQHEGRDAQETALRQNRKAALDRSEVAPGYLRRLNLRRAEVDSLPVALVDDADLGMELLATNHRSDGSALGIWHYTEAIRVKDNSTPEDREAARRVREAFIPQRSEINLSYVETAALAKERAPLLEIRSADLDHFPVPGGTLKRWAQDLIEAGVDTAGLLARRYLLESSGGDSPLSRLRNEIIGLLGRFRAGLADEIREGLVPADADALIFGYLDRLAEDRAKLLAAREARKTTPG